MLVERFHEADRDPATSVVILRAEGRSFCAGYDISPNPARASRRGNALAWHESLTDDVQLEMTPWEMKKPVIASVQGHCLGGGCELVMMCDLTIAADDALFGEPEIRFSNVGPALVMPFIIGLKRARELLFFGDPIDAQTALQYGMVNRVVPRAELAAATLKYARRDGVDLAGGARGHQALHQPRRRNPPVSGTRSTPASTSWPPSTRPAPRSACNSTRSARKMAWAPPSAGAPPSSPTEKSRAKPDRSVGAGEPGARGCASGEVGPPRPVRSSKSCDSGEWVTQPSRPQPPAHRAPARR